MVAQEQLIYPTPAGGSDMSEADLMELLHAVDLEYLLHRHGMHDTVDWGAALSLGVLPLTLTLSLTLTLTPHPDPDPAPRSAPLAAETAGRWTGSDRI
jgi:hypothetical protein